MGQLDVGGLYQKFGLEQTLPQAGGEYKTWAELREVEFKVDLTTVTATPTIIPGTDNIVFPQGVRIEEVVVVNDAAAATGVSIDLGLVRVSDRTTEIDFNGILAAAITADWNALGERATYTQASGTSGALVTGAVLTTFPGHLTINSTATLYTTGLLTIRIKYRKP